MGNAYSKAGVDVTAGYEVVKRIQKHVKRTERIGMMGAIGGFGGCFDLSVLNVKEPVFVSGTDGVGTKLKIAFQADVHSTIGIDCVAMCVNDVIAQGAEPLYFLDYIATGKNIPERLEHVIAGVAEGCCQAGVALIGGETAEMPGMYQENEYDLAGFTVGVAEKSQLLSNSQIKAGDVLIGLPSTGIHSNGYSLVRQIFFEQHKLTGQENLAGLEKSLNEELLTPTKIYVKALLPLIRKGLVNGIAHITGGGFVENIPRIMPDHLAAKITLNSWPPLMIFKILEKYGEIPHLEMFEIFNMGIGMVLAASPDKVEQLQQELTKNQEQSYIIGEVVVKKDTSVILQGES